MVLVIFGMPRHAGIGRKVHASTPTNAYMRIAILRTVRQPNKKGGEPDNGKGEGNLADRDLARNLRCLDTSPLMEPLLLPMRKNTQRLGPEAKPEQEVGASTDIAPKL